MAESRTRALSLVPPIESDSEDSAGAPVLEPGLADVLTLERRRVAQLAEGDEEAFFLDTLAEYEWARDAAGLAASTLERLVVPGSRSVTTTDWSLGD